MGPPARAEGRPRALVQTGSLLLVLVGVFVVRGHAERWCPFGGVETAYAYATGAGALCSMGATNVFLLGAVLLSLLLLRRAFCSHACPIGTASEWIRAGARRRGLAAPPVPPWVDRVLSPLKYGVLVLVVAWTWAVGELVFRSACPAYALLGRHGEDITLFAYLVAGAVVGGSVLTDLPFCRWLCPLAAVMNPVSRLGLARVVREAGSCAGCGKCERACPMGIPVSTVAEVKHARCTTCLACVSACPTQGRGTLALRLPGCSTRAVPSGFVALLVVAVLGGGVAAAGLFPLPSFRWSRGALPARHAVLALDVGELTCRGRANLLVYFLDRDDDLAVAGPLRLEAWPAPGAGGARIAYDPAATTPEALRAALAEPYHDDVAGIFRLSPFRVPGYDPLAPGGAAAGR